MSDITFRATTGGAGGIASAIGKTLAAIRETIARRLQAWRTRSVLRHLSDAQLRDIGLTRSQIDAIAFGHSEDPRMRRHVAE